MQALIQHKYPYLFFTESEYPEHELEETLLASLDYLHNEAYGTCSLMQWIHIMNPLFLHQSVIRYIMFPDELNDEPGEHYMFEYARELYFDEHEELTPKEYADWYCNNHGLQSMCMTYRDWLAEDLKTWAAMKQIVFVDDYFSFRSRKTGTNKLSLSPIKTIW